MYDPDFNIMQQSQGLFAIAKLLVFHISCIFYKLLLESENYLMVVELYAHATFSLSVTLMCNTDDL